MSLDAVISDEMEIELQAAEPTGKESLRSRAIRSSAWTMFSYGGNTVLRLGGNLILTRLLTPKLFGLSALINIFIQGLHMFSDVGVAPSIIQNPRGDEPDFLNTAWTIQSSRGVVIWICSAIIAWPVANFYGIHQLVYLIPIAAFTAVLDNAVSSNYFSRQRHLSLAGTTKLDLSCYLLNLMVMGVWAWCSPTIWAIIAGSLISSLVHLILTHTILPGIRNRPRWNREAVHALFQFGRWIFISTLVTFMAGQCDRLMFAKKIPLELLGVYGIALTLAGMPKEAIIKIVGPITFSVYSRLGTSREAVATAFRKVRGPLLMCGAWAIGGLFIIGPSLIHILYDKRYAAAGWILQVLAISAWFEILENTSGSALLALGRTLWIAAANAGKLISMIVLIPVGFALNGYHGINGFQAALAAVVLSEVVRFGIMALGVSWEGVGNVLIDIGVTSLLAVAASTAYLTNRMIERETGRPILAAVVAAMVVSVPLAPVALMGVRSLITGRRSAPASVANELVPVAA